MNDIVTVEVAHPKSDLDELRRTLGVPDIYGDEIFLLSLIGTVIDDYMNVDKVEAEKIQEYLTEGDISRNWLNK